MTPHVALLAGAVVLPSAELDCLPDDLQGMVARLPPHLVEIATAHPRRVDRRVGAELVTQHILPVSPRSLEVWPLPWQRVNGKAITPLIVLFALAYAKLAAAPVVMGGKRPEANQLSAQ